MLSMSNQWAGSELGELAKPVIRQLTFQSLKFDVVLVGSMFEGGQLLINQCVKLFNTAHQARPWCD
jgi:hypothetical protein